MIVVISILLLTVSCSSQTAATRIEAFSTAVALVTNNTRSAFEAVERVHHEMLAARVVANYDKKGFQPDEIKPLLRTEELAARMRVLDALQIYAQKLTVVMGDSQLSAFDLQAKEFGGDLAALTNNLVRQQYLSKNSTISDRDIGLFTTAINALGRWFIEWTRDRKIKDEVKSMQLYVREICRLLSEDLGTTSQESGSKDAAGLRAIVWNDFTDTLQQQDEFIGHNLKALGPVATRAEVLQLIALVSNRAQTDATLKATQTALKSLRETHEKLADALEQHPGEFEQSVMQLVMEGNRIKYFYELLNKK